MDVSLQTQTLPSARTKLSSSSAVGDGSFQKVLQQGNQLVGKTKDSVAEGSVAERSVAEERDPAELDKAFNQFVGESLYGQLMKTLRESTGEVPYFNGGRAEKMFQAQLDQKITQRLAEESGHELTGPMLDLFHLQMK